MPPQNIHLSDARSISGQSRAPGREVATIKKTLFKSLLITLVIVIILIAFAVEAK